MTTTKKDIYPKKPTTKRDKHYYDLGAKEQANVFNELYDKKWKQWSRKDLGDYQSPIVEPKINWTGVTLFILATIFLLYAMSVDQTSLNDGLIH